MMPEKKFKHICECINCGNEAEMVVTCTLADEIPPNAKPKIVAKQEGKTKGHAVCSHCGGEADIWLDV
jgi:transcription elongation factor Elf1